MPLKIITINIPDQYLDCIKVLTDFGYFPSRSEAIRQAIKQFLYKETQLIKDLDPDVFGNLKDVQMKALIGGN